MLQPAARDLLPWHTIAPSKCASSEQTPRAVAAFKRSKRTRAVYPTELTGPGFNDFDHDSAEDVFIGTLKFDFRIGNIGFVTRKRIFAFGIRHNTLFTDRRAIRFADTPLPLRATWFPRAGEHGGSWTHGIVCSREGRAGCKASRGNRPATRPRARLALQ